MIQRTLAVVGILALLLSGADACDQSRFEKRSHNAPVVKSKREVEHWRTFKARHRHVAAHLEARQDQGVPPPEQITKDMPSATPSAIFTAFPPGATSGLKGAPPVPNLEATFNRDKYPTTGVVPPIDSPEIKSFMDKLKAATIPNIHPSKEPLCVSDPDLLAKAGPDGNCWWTCGGCLRETDVSVCPDKNTWGVSFDDGPSEYTAEVLNHLHAKNVKATFFVVGGSVYWRPEVLQAEYLLGHEISIHTWSHSRPLTTLTNEEIVAELAWTAVIIKDVLGVTPRTFRAPKGDIDDCVRAVAKAIGLTPIQWTGSGETEFDTNDWRIPDGQVSGTQSLAAFQKILDQAASLSTGFIVLEHDLYQSEVDMGVGYFLPLAEKRQLSLKPIYDCLHQPLENSYFETILSNSTIGGGLAPASPTNAKGNKDVPVTTVSSTAIFSRPSSTPGAASAGALPESITLLASLSVALLGFGMGHLAN